MSAEESKRAPEKPQGTRGGSPGSEARGSAKAAGRPWHRRPAIIGLLIFGVIVGVVAGALLWRHNQAHVTTDDAYVDGVSQLVSPQIQGRVLRVLANDNQDVTAGQPLVELDPADYQARVDEAEATGAQARAQMAQAQAQREIYAAQVAVARANQDTAEANATHASNQLGRYRRLRTVNAGAVSDEQLDSAIAADASARAAREAALKSVAAASSQLDFSASQVEAAQAAIGSAKSQIAQAALTLSYTRVLARIDGRIANKAVADGDIVGPGAPIMAVVPRGVYVTANLKETQLAHLRRGQPVTIDVDAYPDLKLSGHVDSIEPASGQTFSALPAQNATGNWVKVVQRVPVKIVFDRLPDDPDRRLAPGMSVEISVRVQ